MNKELGEMDSHENSKLDFTESNSTCVLAVHDPKNGLDNFLAMLIATNIPFKLFTCLSCKEGIYIIWVPEEIEAYREGKPGDFEDSVCCPSCGINLPLNLSLEYKPTINININKHDFNKKQEKNKNELTQ